MLNVLRYFTSYWSMLLLPCALLLIRPYIDVLPESANMCNQA